MALDSSLVCYISYILDCHVDVQCTGEEFLDTITLGSLVVKDQSIGVAEIAEGFGDVDGILGFVL